MRRRRGLRRPLTNSKLVSPEPLDTVALKLTLAALSRLMSTSCFRQLVDIIAVIGVWELDQTAAGTGLAAVQLGLRRLGFRYRAQKSCRAPENLGGLTPNADRPPGSGKIQPAYARRVPVV